MNTPYNLQIIFGIVATMVVAGSWWYAAFSLSDQWILYALAVVATIGWLLSGAIILLAQTHQSAASLALISQFRGVVGLFNAALYVVFASWLVSRLQNNK